MARMDNPLATLLWRRELSWRRALRFPQWLMVLALLGYPFAIQGVAELGDQRLEMLLLGFVLLGLVILTTPLMILDLAFSVSEHRTSGMMGQILMTSADSRQLTSAMLWPHVIKHGLFWTLLSTQALTYVLIHRVNPPNVELFEAIAVAVMLMINCWFQLLFTALVTLRLCITRLRRQVAIRNTMLLIFAPPLVYMLDWGKSPFFANGILLWFVCKVIAAAWIYLHLRRHFIELFALEEE
jgi:hypothetical protein